MKKFELTTEQKINWLGRTLYTIRACALSDVWNQRI